VMTSGLNTSTTFIRALGEMVMAALDGPELVTESAGESNFSRERLVVAG